MVSLSFHYGVKMKKLLLSAVALSLAIGPAYAAREQIRIVGSSTVYPFTTVVAEEFGKKTGAKTPVVESTGTGGGFKLFCEGVGIDTPDVTNASRAIKEGEAELCAANGVTPIEVEIGIDAIVVARAKDSGTIDVTRKQLFQALAESIIVVRADGTLGFEKNPNTHWNNHAGQQVPMMIFGPPPTSGTRDSFVELVMEPACKELIEEAGITVTPEEEKKYCTTMRTDGVYIEAGENDNLIVQKLVNNPDSFGIFGFSFLDGNRSSVVGVSIEGVVPDFETIASGNYAISRPLFVYFKEEHIGLVPNLDKFKEEYENNAMGQDGYLVDRGLIPLE